METKVNARLGSTMRSYLRLLPPISVALAIVTFPSFANEVRGPATAIRGDTLVVKDSQISLWAIGTPDLRRDHGHAARHELDRIIKDRTVTCAPVGDHSRDRMVARCVVGEQDLAAEMLRRGVAWHLRSVTLNTAYAAIYDQAEADARQGRKRIWAKQASDDLSWWDRSPTLLQAVVALVGSILTAIVAFCGIKVSAKLGFQNLVEASNTKDRRERQSWASALWAELDWLRKCAFRHWMWIAKDTWVNEITDNARSGGIHAAQPPNEGRCQPEVWPIFDSPVFDSAPEKLSLLDSKTTRKLVFLYSLIAAWRRNADRFRVDEVRTLPERQQLVAGQMCLFWKDATLVCARLDAITTAKEQEADNLEQGVESKIQELWQQSIKELNGKIVGSQKQDDHGR